MSEVMMTSAMPINKVNFSWKIENFAPMLKTYGTTGLVSPELKVLSGCKGKEHPLQLRLKKDHWPHIIKEDGVVKAVKDFTLVQVEVINSSDDSNFGLAGCIDIDMEGVKLSGVFGNVEEAEFTDEWNFKNQSTSIYVPHTHNPTTCNYVLCNFTGFCVDVNVQTIHLKGQLSTPGLVANSTVILPCSEKISVEHVGTSILLADIKSLLLKAEDYSDFTILCEDERFPCHEAILRTRSPVLDRMFQQDMTEKTTRMLTIEDVGSNTMAAVLEYLYTGEITKEVDNKSELIYIGDKYNIKGLLELCFHSLSEVDVALVGDMLFMADRLNLLDFKNAAMQRIQAYKSKFVKDQDFLEKLKESPHLLLEFFQL